MSEMSFVVTGMIPPGKGEGRGGVKSGKEGKFNEKDTEMVQLTKKFLKQTARHSGGSFSVLST